jgi:N,N'-diacetyllegionaminate synthase
MARAAEARGGAVLVVAEVGSVHDGSLGNALALIDAAAECGVDAVKFQTHLAEAESLADAPAPAYFSSEPRIDYFRRTAFSEDQWRALKARCLERQVAFLSSPFSLEAVDLLERIGLDTYKIPSGEVTNIPLLEKVAALGKPIILSSGMSSWGELDRAVVTVRKSHQSITVLQCTSEYPCSYERVGLNVMQEMRERYGLPAGLSDHTLTPYASLAAVTLGASVIERHFTFSRSMYGSDARHSLEPHELADLVRGIRALEVMRAKLVDKDDLAPFAEMKRIFEKSVVTVREVAAGAVFDRSALALKKPGTGLPAARLEEIIGSRARRRIAAGTLVSADDVDWEAGS